MFVFWGGRKRPAVDWLTATGLFKVLVAKSLIAGVRETRKYEEKCPHSDSFSVFAFMKQKANNKNYGIKESRHTC